jgi:hypothetical protein
MRCEKQGKAWATRLPTALTILQAQSIGLNVDKALPFDENLSDYEDPTKVPQSSQIALSDVQMGGSTEVHKRSFMQLPRFKFDLSRKFEF